MKKYFVCIFICIGLTSCEQKINDSKMKKYTDTMSVSVKSGSIKKIESYSANVVFYTGNSRKIGGITEKQRYRISVKEVNGSVLYRADYPSKNYSDGIARSVLATNDELFIFHTGTNNLEHRTNLTTSAIDKYDGSFSEMNRMAILGKISDFQNFRTKLYDIYKDISVDDENKTMLINIPSEEYSHFNITFDLEDQTLLGSETKEILEDETIITTNTKYLYQDTDGEIIKIGTIIETHYDIKNLIDASAYALPIIESEEDVRIITDEELEAIEEQGGLVYNVVPVIGDPSDPDYTETLVQLFEDIEINSVDDTLFDILW